VEPNINSVEIHPQVNNMDNPVDAALVGAGFTVALFKHLFLKRFFPVGVTQHPLNAPPICPSWNPNLKNPRDTFIAHTPPSSLFKAIQLYEPQF
jgi:hypothetical protein